MNCKVIIVKLSLLENSTTKTGKWIDTKIGINSSKSVQVIKIGTADERKESPNIKINSKMFTNEQWASQYGKSNVGNNSTFNICCNFNICWQVTNIFRTMPVCRDAAPALLPSVPDACATTAASASLTTCGVMV
ncbi:hypothetical protein CDAR_518811 [Caerostris darwini]|uniref:Uncharacterized protein n=1 Tax=Caerostris darwini TaxID=1538125 RepID=A0AAV4PRT6_9ARAC|nr:hypothetical protein CDAR_518811 [Caerostris darwini]